MTTVTQPTFFESLRDNCKVLAGLGLVVAVPCWLWMARYYILTLAAAVFALWLFISLCNWMFEGMPKWLQRCAIVGVGGYSLIYCFTH